MPSPFSLKWTPAAGGAAVTKTLDAWGINAATLKLSSSAGDRSGNTVDALSLTTAETLAAAPQWGAGDTLDLYYQKATGDGPVTTRIFSGTNKTAVQTWRAPAMRKAYDVEGPSWWLRRLEFAQPWSVFAAPDDPTQIGWAILFLSNRTLADEITSAVQRVVDQGPPLSVGTIDTTMLQYLRPRLIEDLTCTQVINQCLKLAIDAALWFDYSGGTPALNVTRFGNMPTVTRALQPTQFELQDAYETRLNFVRIHMKKNIAQKQTGVGPAPTYTPVYADAGTGDAVARYLAGATTVLWPTAYGGTQFGGITVTVDWADDFNEAAAAGAAQYLYEAANNVAQQGRFTCFGPGGLPDFALSPGTRLNITGFQAAWATMAAPLQEVTHDLFRMTTTGRFGMPQQLGFSDYEQIKRDQAAIVPSADMIASKTTGVSAGYTGSSRQMNNHQGSTGDAMAAFLKEYGEASIDYCESGSDATGTFLKKL